MNQQLSELFTDYGDPEEHLPPELLLNPEHPQNDPFYTELAHIKRAIRDAQSRVRPLQRHAAVLHRNGLNHTEVANKLDVHPATVGKWLKTPTVQRLLAVMNHHQQLLDGPNFDHRKHLLYVIALSNKDRQPRVSISAITEINKMSGTYVDQGRPSGPGNVVNIQINGELLPRGPLDTLPESYETRLLTMDHD
jgi:hypothetical protein